MKVMNDHHDYPLHPDGAARRGEARRAKPVQPPCEMMGAK